MVASADGPPTHRLRRRGLPLGLLLAAVALAPPGTGAQETGTGAAGSAGGPPHRVWLAGGLGAGGGSDVEGGVGMMQLAWQRGPHHVAVRTVGITDFYDATSEVGVVYGRTRTASWGHAALAAGLAGVHLDRCGDASFDGCWAVGVPVVAEAALQALLAGLGAQLFANLNTRAPYAGLVLFLQLGWMP